MQKLNYDMKILNSLLAFAWFICAGVAAALFWELLNAFIDPALHTPVLWAVNVYRFAWLELALYVAGVVFGCFLVYFLALIKMKKDRSRYEKLIEDLKREAR